MKRAKIKNNTVRNLCISFAMIGGMSLVVGPVTSADTQQYYKICVNDKSYGNFVTKQDAVKAVSEARKLANSESDGVMLAKFDYSIVETAKDSKAKNDNVVDDLCETMLEGQINEKVKAYVLKADGYSITLNDEAAVIEVLDKVVDQYDVNDEYAVILDDNENKEQNTLKAFAVPSVAAVTGDITSVSFGQDVCAMPVYTVESEISTVDDAVADIVNNSRINVYTTQTQQYTEEYTLDTEYIEVDSWYTSQKQVVQEAQTGVHDVVASVTYSNGAEVDRTIQQDNVVTEPVAKVVKVGTKEAPTFIKPLNGGSFSSPFGSRWGRQHKGVDWSCSVGTTVFASCGGTVSYAGWQNGFGNTIVISHGNGLKTRYAHLSQISVSSGQKVSQGDKIGLSGNTGNSTGPHLHFEVLLDGEQVNPLNYL